MMSFAHLNVANVIFREIGKFKDFDKAVFHGHLVTKVKADNSVEDIVAKHAKNPHPTKNGQWPGQKHSELSVEVTPGNNLYLIKLDPATEALFMAGTDPINVLPPELGAAVLSDVGLAFMDADELRFMPAADFAAATAVPQGAMLTFTCDRAKLEQIWKGIMPDGHKEFPIKIPFYLNLYDSRSKKPVWTFCPPDHAFRPAAAADKQVETHGGIHPSDDPHGDDHLHFVTHGGIHPGTPSQLLY